MKSLKKSDLIEKNDYITMEQIILINKVMIDKLDDYEEKF